MFCFYVTFNPILVAKNCQSFGGGFLPKTVVRGRGSRAGGAFEEPKSQDGRLTLPSDRAPAAKFEHMGYHRLAFGTFYNSEGRRGSRGVTSDILNR